MYGGYGQLTSLTEQQAVIAFKPTMKNIAEPKIPELAKVFSDILGRPIVVRLEIAGQISPPTMAPSPPVPSPPLLPPPPEPIAPTEAKPDKPVVRDEPIAPLKPPIELPLESIPFAERLPQRIVTEPEPLSSAPDFLAELDSVELFPPADFAEPPDSLDFDRATLMPLNGAEELEPEIDPLVRSATDTIVEKFDGEIIDRTDALFDKIVSG
jgi:hypothetical protein